MSERPVIVLKVSFEHVSAIRFPQYYRDERPIVAAADVPAEHWIVTERSGDGVWDQYNGLRKLMAAGELIRNPRVFKAAAIAPAWRDVTPQDAGYE